jgi:heme/copper-type cytochrome/quinol oxidase subunit 3
MAEMTSGSRIGPSHDLEEAAFYHEASLNAAWIGARLALGALTFGFGAFVFAFFYLRSTNSFRMWYPAGFHGPQMWAGSLVTGLVVASAVVQSAALTRIKAGRKRAWMAGAAVALALGLAAIAFQVWQLLNLPFYPGSSGFASVFVGSMPVFIAVAFGVLIWLHMLIGRCRPIQRISFIEQPPTYAEAFAVQRFQASLSAFTLVWNYLAALAVVLWILFYLVH